MSYFQKSKTEQIQDALKSNANLTRKADKMLREKSVDADFQRLLIKDKKRLSQEKRKLTDMLGKTQGKTK
tara:strand:+ start:106 stop:315 length:210 start_codon:yes stop_codon:yes gene_type:complete